MVDVESMLEQLDDDDPQARVIACNELAKSGDVEAIPKLIATYELDDERAVRQAAKEALAVFKAMEAQGVSFKKGGGGGGFLSRIRILLVISLVALLGVNAVMFVSGSSGDEDDDEDDAASTQSLGPCEMQLLGRISSQVELMESAAQTLLAELETKPDNFCTTLADTPLPETIEFSEQEQQNYADLYAVFGPDSPYAQSLESLNAIALECQAGPLSSVIRTELQLQQIDTAILQDKLREYDSIFIKLADMEEKVDMIHDFFTRLEQGETIESLTAADYCAPFFLPEPIQATQEQRADNTAYDVILDEGYNQHIGTIAQLNTQRLSACGGEALAPEDINSAITQLEDVRASLQTIQDSLAPLGTIECRVEQ
jgi:hypothetical protein